jgi:hypothetical protein
MMSDKDADYQLYGVVRQGYTGGVGHKRVASRPSGKESPELRVLDVQTNVSRSRRGQCTYTAGTAAKIENIRAIGRCDPSRQLSVDETYARQALNPIVDLAVRGQTV